MAKLKINLAEKLLSVFKTFSGLPKWAKILIGVLSLIILILYFISSSLSAKSKLYRNRFIADEKEIEKLRYELLYERNKSYELEQLYEPFKKLANTRYPYLGDESALEMLLKDFENAQKLMDQREHVQLSEQRLNQTLENLKGLKDEFQRAGINIQVTYEVWVMSIVKDLAAKLVKTLSTAGLNVSGPEFATIYRTGAPVSPMEFQYNEGDEEHVQQLFKAIEPIINTNPKFTKRDVPSRSRNIRVHFLGQVKFDLTGVATVY